jgi:glutathione S-transferase
MFWNSSKIQESVEAEFQAVSKVMLGNLEARLAGRGGQFFAGNNLTWADLMMFNVGVGLGGGALAATPLIQNLVERVGDIPNIKKWMENRPVTFM